MPENLPPWIARNQGDRDRMVAWVNAHLAEERNTQSENNDLPSHPTQGSSIVVPVVQTSARGFTRWLAVEAAWRGYIKPLRSLYPDLAPFLHLPTRGQRGKYRRANSKQGFALRAAVEDVPRIRALWQEHYGRKNRRPDDGPSAEQIAAERWDVELEDVMRRLK
jgi:hypothetical protein